MSDLVVMMGIEQTRHVLPKFRVRTGGAQGNQMHQVDPTTFLLFATNEYVKRSLSKLYRDSPKALLYDKADKALKSSY